MREGLKRRRPRATPKGEAVNLFDAESLHGAAPIFEKISVRPPNQRGLSILTTRALELIFRSRSRSSKAPAKSWAPGKAETPGPLPKKRAPARSGAIYRRLDLASIPAWWRRTVCAGTRRVAQIFVLSPCIYFTLIFLQAIASDIGLGHGLPSLHPLFTCPRRLLQVAAGVF